MPPPFRRWVTKVAPPIRRRAEEVAATRWPATRYHDGAAEVRPEGTPSGPGAPVQQEHADSDTCAGQEAREVKSRNRLEVFLRACPDSDPIDAQFWPEVRFSGQGVPWPTGCTSTGAIGSGAFLRLRTAAAFGNASSSSSYLSLAQGASRGTMLAITQCCAISDRKMARRWQAWLTREASLIVDTGSSGPVSMSRLPYVKRLWRQAQARRRAARRPASEVMGTWRYVWANAL
jgi:hypothetical protein